jgi:hypothetical protein
VKTVPSRPTLLPGGRQPQTTTRRRCDGDAGRQVPPRQKIGAHPRYPPPTERKLVHVFSRPLPLSRLRFNLDGSRLANANVQDKQLTPITSRAFSAFHPKDTPKFCFLKQQVRTLISLFLRSPRSARVCFSFLGTPPTTQKKSFARDGRTQRERLITQPWQIQ